VSHANKDGSVEQLLRHELILGLLPSKDSALDSNAIHQRVANQGVQVDKRTIQRDLSELEQKFPHVHSRPKGKAKLWWAEKSLSRLSMLPTDAMNLVMIMDHAARFGMAAQVENLAPLRDYATSLLKGNRPSQNCVGKVISNTRFVVLESGLVKPEVLKVVQQALLDDASIEALYLKRGASEPQNPTHQTAGAVLPGLEYLPRMCFQRLARRQLSLPPPAPLIVCQGYIGKT